VTGQSLPAQEEAKNRLRVASLINTKKERKIEANWISAGARKKTRLLDGPIVFSWKTPERKLGQ